MPGAYHGRAGAASVTRGGILLSDDNRRLVRETIRPARSVAMHLPPDEAANARRLFAAAGVRAVLLVEPGTPAVVE